MFTLNNEAKIFFYNKPVSLHKGFDSLSAIAKEDLGINFSPNTYVLFCNLRKDRIKILFFQESNVAIFSMRFPRTLNFKYGEFIIFTPESFEKFSKNFYSRAPRKSFKI